MHSKSVMGRTGIISGLFLFLILNANAQAVIQTVTLVKAKFWDYRLPVSERVQDVVSKMTLEEKVLQMQNDAPAIPRLGIPAYNWWSECLHGVARNGIATVFPQAIGMASTWNPELIYQEAEVISTEARAKHHEAARKGERGIYQGLTFWSPNINIFRDPRWGRGQETYGEDPYLTGRIGVAFVKGLQGSDTTYLKVVATAKHYAVHSGPEPLRHKFDAWCSERDLYDTYLPAFEALIREGNAGSVMGAYNRFWNDPCCASDLLLDKILRKKWGFEGYVTSDCGAIWDIYNGHDLVASADKAAAMGVKAGCDLTCGNEYRDLVSAVKKGYISEPEIDRSLKRLFTARFMLGMFDPDSLVEYSRIPFSENDKKEHRQLALKVARESIVLLKNENNLLPLSRKISSIAVIGPYADKVSVLLGNYNGIPSKPVTILQGIKNKSGNKMIVRYSPGVDAPEDMFQFVPIDIKYTKPAAETLSHGFNAYYFNNMNLAGEPVIKKTDTITEHHFRLYSPCPGIPADSFSIRWTGLLSAPQTGYYELGILSDDKCKVWFNGNLIIDNWDSCRIWELRSERVFIEKGKYYPVRIDYADITGWAGIDFLWKKNVDDKMISESLKEAVLSADSSDVVIFAGGISPDLEGEEMSVSVEGFSGGDRTDLDIPANQQSLLEKLRETGKPVILVLTNGSALSVNWAVSNIPAIVETWYPGEEGGNALADVIFGDYNPAGRLPVTFYKSVKDLPPFEDYSMKGRTYRYFTGLPLFPFGFGLSYTTFDYREASFNKESASAGDTLSLKVVLKNSGNYDGDEVVQVYAKGSDPGAEQPLKALKAFKRIHLLKGEIREVTIPFVVNELRLFDPVKQDYTVEPGQYEIMIGSSSTDIRQYATLKIRKE